jgi:hypothetical protein
MEHVPIPTTLLVHCDVIKEDDIQEISVPPATSTSEVIRLVLERYGLEKRWESYCLAYIKGLKRNRSFRSSNTKPRVLLSTDCPLLLGLHQSTGRYAFYALRYLGLIALAQAVSLRGWQCAGACQDADSRESPRQHSTSCSK